MKARPWQMATSPRHTISLRTREGVAAGSRCPAPCDDCIAMSAALPQATQIRTFPTFRPPASASGRQSRQRDGRRAGGAERNPPLFRFNNETVRQREIGVADSHCLTASLPHYLTVNIRRVALRSTRPTPSHPAAAKRNWGRVMSSFSFSNTTSTRRPTLASVYSASSRLPAISAPGASSSSTMMLA